MDLKRRNAESGGEASGGVCDGVTMASKHNKKKLKCYKCGKIGHKRVDCRESDRESEKRKVMHMGRRRT